jgi:hypothetical protein
MYRKNTIIPGIPRVGTGVKALKNHRYVMMYWCIIIPGRYAWEELSEGFWKIICFLIQVSSNHDWSAACGLEPMYKKSHSLVLNKDMQFHWPKFGILWVCRELLSHLFRLNCESTNMNRSDVKAKAGINVPQRRFPGPAGSLPDLVCWL